MVYSWLEPSKQVPFTKDVIGFDIETCDNNKTFLCASLVGDNLKKIFFKKQDVIDELKKKRYANTYIVASNLSFDFFGTLFRMKDVYNFTTLFRGSGLISAWSFVDKDKYVKKSKKKNSKRQFIDTFNYAPFSVEKLGKIIGIKKLKSPSFIGQKPRNQKEWDELIEYNYRDSEVSMKFTQFLFDSLQKLGGNPRITIASSAMSIFRNRFLKDTYYRHKTDILLEQFNAYFGGRTEAFMRGYITDMNYYDFNSLYPSVMLKGYPNPNTLRTTYKNTKEYIMSFDGISKVDIFVPRSRYPLLPMRDREKVVFGYGNLSGWWTHVELREAMKDGAILKKVYKTYYYKENIYPFVDYVKTLYALRMQYKKEGNPMEVIVKLLLNSLYGKFGQKFINRDNWLPFNHTPKELSKFSFVERVGNFIRVKKGMDMPSYFCFPIWASYVTAYGRIKLWKAIRQADPVYVDTDSLITKKTLPTSDELGDLKLEMGVKKGIIVRPKFYGLLDSDNNDYVKIKGLGRRLTYSQFMGFMKSPSISYDKFTKFKEAIRHNLIPNEIRSINKNMSLEDDKRVWSSSFSIDSLQDSEPHEMIDGVRAKDHRGEMAKEAKREKRREKMMVVMRKTSP